MADFQKGVSSFKKISVEEQKKAVQWQILKGIWLKPLKF